ncbi:MAG: hypothetical protein WCE64_16605 [Bacteroidales bacterium]
MKTTSLRCIYLLFVLIIPTVIISCHASREDPLFVGTWQYNASITTDDLVFFTIRTLKLTKNTYEETYLIRRESSGTISGIIGTRGDLIPAHRDLTFQLNALGTCVRDELDACTDNIAWHPEGSPYWIDNIQFFKPDVGGEFEADQATLWLKRDLNMDGDFEDPGEDVMFERI